jgi:hypothetical protein
MKVACGLDFVLNSPIHIISVGSHEISFQDPFPTPEEGDYFSGKNPAGFELAHGNIKIKVILNLALVQNPMAPEHKAIGSDKISLVMKMDWQGDVNLADASLTFPIRDYFCSAAEAVVSKFIDYCRFSRMMPLHQSINIGHIRDMRWLDEQGNTISSVIWGNLMEFPGLGGSLHCSPIRPSDLPEIVSFLESDEKYSIIDELRANALDAYYKNQIETAVMMLAVSTEVAIKRAFFHVDEATGAVFDYLQDIGKLNIPPKELISNVAARAYGRNFSEEFRGDYEQIEELFRCRNKVVHSAKTQYTSLKNKLATADRNSIARWWISSANLLKWLSTLR